MVQGKSRSWLVVGLDLGGGERLIAGGFGFLFFHGAGGELLGGICR